MIKHVVLDFHTVVKLTELDLVYSRTMSRRFNEFRKSLPFTKSQPEWVRVAVSNKNKFLINKTKNESVWVKQV